MTIFQNNQEPKHRGQKPERVEAVIWKEMWEVAKDNFYDYVDHATRAEVHKLNASTALKPDAKSDEAYA